MNKKLAANIARDFLEKFNPSLWNGKGEMPKDFVIYKNNNYKIGNNEELEMRYVNDAHETVSAKPFLSCSIFKDGKTVSFRCTDQINSEKIITDKILELYGSAHASAA